MSDLRSIAADVPTQAKCVLIGAGIVDNGLAHHLAEIGSTDVVAEYKVEASLG